MFKVLALLAMLVISCVPTPELKDVQKSNTTDQQLTPSEATDQSHHLKIPGPAILNTIIPGKNSAVLAWSADPEWGSVTSYNLRYNFVPDLTQSVLISNISSPYVFSNLMPNRNYYIQIEAVNSFGKSVSDVHNFKTSIDPPGLILIEQVVAAQTQAEISWSIESSGGQVATLFLEYSQSSDFANSTIVSQNISSPYTLTGLQANTTYFFRVKAENQAGSTQSIAEVFTTLENPPVAPILSPVVAQQTAALLSWSLSTASSSTTKYTVRYGQNAQLANAEVQENIMTTQFNLTGLAPNTQYYYQVIAINSVGEAASAIVGFQTLAPPANAPNILQTTNITASSATLNYSPNAISGAPSSYRIRFSTTPNSFSGNGQSTTQTQFTLTGLQMNTTYYFEVAAMYSNATPSATGSFVTDFTAPLAPNLGTVSTLATSAVINWTSGGGGPTDSYTVRYSLFENMNSFQQVPNITSLSTTLNNLNANTKYYYRVIATNTKGSASSIVKDFTTQNIAPSAPTSLAASVVNSSTANLSWSGGSGGGVATSFNLIYATNAQLNNPIEVPGVTSPHQLSGLQANTVYYFRIKAINSADSTESSTQSFATNGLAPVAQVITDIIDITTNSAKVTWQNAPNPSQNSFQNTLFPVM